jgi:surfactin synthase thioesterase subunit
MEAIHASRWRHVAIFGDCSGSIVALALAQAMQNKGIPRLHHLFAAGIPNPITVDPNPRHKWSDGQFAAWAVDYGLLPRELLDDDRAREYFLRQIRNDFALIEQYKAKADPLECKITTFVGSSDALASESFAVWSSLTTKQWQHDTLDCGHLVNTEGSRQLQSAIFANLTDIVQTV